MVEFHPPTGAAMSFLIIDRDGNRLSDLLSAYWGPYWAPTQDILAYQNRQDDRLYITDGNGVTQVVSEPFSPRMCGACSIPPRWSPDGRRVALIVTIGPMATLSDIPLCLASLDGNISCVSLLAWNMRNPDAQWLDNRYLLIRGTIQLEEGTPIYRYLVLDAESDTMREVTTGTDLTPTPSPKP